MFSFFFSLLPAVRKGSNPVLKKHWSNLRTMFYLCASLLSKDAPREG